MSEKTIAANAPFVIKKCTTVSDLMSDRSIRAAMGVFRIQLPSSAMYKSEGRGYGPCHADMSNALRAALASYAPTGFEVPSGLDNTLLQKTFKQLLMFGQDISYKNCSLERQGLAAVRYQLTGTRQIVVFNYRALLDYSVSANSVRGENQDLFDWMADLIKGIQVPEQLDLMKSTVWRATIPQESF
eukprot:4418937-Pyramimonas_sp.AAC.1